MNGPRLAIIDLGTNTFHLLIIEKAGAGWSELFRKRVFVNLAEDGIEHIGAAAFARARSTMTMFAETIIDQQVDNIKAIGTAALRTASNARELCRQITAETGITVEVIDGDQEAYWIKHGVRAAIPRRAHPLLIMDIGGGSVEFILENEGRTVYSDSLPIGVGVLYDLFHDSEPISPEALRAIDVHLGQTLSGLIKTLEDYPDTVLVGASGTFEVIHDIVHGAPAIGPMSIAHRHAFEQIYRTIIPMTLEQRLADPQIPEARAQYIVVALHLAHFVLQLVRTDLLYLSNYALKEGIAVEWLENLD